LIYSVVGHYSLILGLCAGLILIFFSIQNFKNSNQLDTKILSFSFLQLFFVLISFLIMKIAITGASGKTGYRISEEAVKKGYKVRQIIRKNSKVSAGLESLETIRVSLDKKGELDKALKDIDALIIATGARASLDLTGPAKVDALGVYRQLESRKRVGIKRVILVSSLCTGKLFHPLNLFGLSLRLQ